MLDLFRALEHTGVDTVVGRTPRDWALEPKGSYLEIHVRPSTAKEAKPWRDLVGQIEREVAAIQREVIATKAATSLSGTASGRAKARAEREIKDRVADYLAGKDQTDEELLADHQRALDTARQALVTGVWVCESDEDPVDLGPLREEVSAAEEAGDDARLAAARRALESAVSVPELLLPTADPRSRREMTSEELDVLFRAELPNLEPGQTARLIPPDWTPVGTGRMTLSQAILWVIRRLAEHGAAGVRHRQDAEKKASLAPPTSGPRAAPTGDGARPRPATSTPGNAPPAAGGNGPESAAGARPTRTAAA